MVVANEEPALVLQVEVCGKSSVRNLVDDFLLDLFIEDLLAVVGQFLHVVGREVEDGGENRCGCGAGRVHVSLTNAADVVGVFLNPVENREESAAEVAWVGVVLV